MNTPLVIERNVSLRNLNTFGIDAKASALLHVTNAVQLAAVRNDPELSAMPRLVLGGGSNILLTGDFAGLVLQMETRGIAVTGDDEDATYVRAAAGENWHQFVLWTLNQGLAGLENLALIPGCVGAAPVQNIGAYGAEVKDTLHSLTAFDFDTGNVRMFMNADCAFNYRDSIFKRTFRNRMVILDVTFALPKRWQPNATYADLAQELAARGIASPSAHDISEAVIAVRTRKLPDPTVFGNAGSFFKNPIVSAKQLKNLAARFPQLVSYPQADGSHKLAAGWLVDQAGWKGKTSGAAGVSETQALVLVNRGGASGQDIAQLAQAIQTDVATKFGVKLEPEPLIL
ncbi:MAG: UDP-N-acetylmuramate dehydrogenase [Burkholderiaceae bacterium]|nr:UDP-N-acetylmuramate dehydrogenase [Burkholderiaceae bacterium]